jgi:hypothetical protein
VYLNSIAIKAGKAEIQLAKFRTFDLSDVLYGQVLSYDIEGAAEAVAVERNTCGGWSAFTKPVGDALQLFESTFKKLVGVSYQPVLVATQVVSGINYLFLANATLATLISASYPVVIRIGVDAGGRSTIQGIKRLAQPGSAGAYGVFGDNTEESDAALKESFVHFVGSDFQSLAVSTQIVAGKNYRYAGNLKMVVPGAEPRAAFVEVYKPLTGKTQIMDIKEVYEI